MSPAALQFILALLNATLPGGIALVQDIIALFKKYPGLTPAQVLAVVQTLANQANVVDDATLAQILADQAAHGEKPPVP